MDRSVYGDRPRELVNRTGRTQWIERCANFMHLTHSHAFFCAVRVLVKKTA